MQFITESTRPWCLERYYPCGAETGTFRQKTPWLPTTCLLASPGHQQLSYWLSRLLNPALVCCKDENLRTAQLQCSKLIEMVNTFYIFSVQFSNIGDKTLHEKWSRHCPFINHNLENTEGCYVAGNPWTQSRMIWDLVTFSNYVVWQDICWIFTTTPNLKFSECTRNETKLFKRSTYVTCVL